jgi:hypothetical protein
MSEPVNIHRYVKIVVKDELPKEILGDWFRAVKKTVPSGVMTTIQTTAQEGLRSAVMVHRSGGEDNAYIIPMTRDLSDGEIEPAVEQFSSQHPDLDFEIEVSSSEVANASDKPKVEIPDESFSNLCVAWAKKQHEDWFKDRTDAGWRYGINMSVNQKTHPLLRPWHELPDKYRNVNYDQPQNLLDLLNDQGYAVISKTELDSLLNLVRGR